MYHLLFNHSSAEGHLGCSSLWLIQINLLWTVVYRILCGLKFTFLWDKCPGKWMLGCMVSTCLVLHKTAKHVSRVAVPSCIATSNGWEIQFLWILTSCQVFFSKFSYSIRCMVMSHHAFDLHFPNDGENLFLISDMINTAMMDIFG